MISVVICSIKEILAEQVSKNIHDTIGVPFELIVIDNNLLKKGIAHVYNLGAGRAKYDIICFVHEDVLFQTQGWGKIITGYFNRDPGLGMIGVAGSKYKSSILSGWWQGLPAMDCCNILNFDDNNNTVRILANPDPAVKLQQVVTLDGVFLCASKPAWQAIPFNESLITGFHFYDIDFSFSVSEKFNVAVTYEIDIVHLNRAGDFGNAWVQHAIDWHHHHRQKLPRILNGKIKTSGAGNERKIFRNWLYRLRYENISLGNRLRVIFYSGHWLHYRSWAYVGLFLFYKPYHKFISVFRTKRREHAEA